MRASFLLFGLLFLSQFAIGQEETDAERLSKLSYLELADNIDCENHKGSTLERRICLNLKFQEVDSVLEVRFTAFLETLDSDSLVSEYQNYQQHWVENRRRQSNYFSEGLRGHLLGMAYLDSMVKTTMQRIEELEFLLEMY